MNCISTFTTPSPLHVSHRPPSVLNEKWAAVYPICTASGCEAIKRRISSYAFIYVTGFEREDLPIGS